ncbi:hypothetical protein [uncultured Ferrimonas sp.]|uniref:hypothetical protein n=1 Tax=uncultured Ferrimonas sp. TaxID=432640 RepID=UPI002604F550|nr:hypothetical protein [uncultured Ferrimonas sp.]
MLQLATALLVSLLSFAALANISTVAQHPDGTSYEIIGIPDRMTKPDPANCGYNDAGVAILGVYDREQRQYSTWENNRIVSSWAEVKEIFVTCHTA